MMHAKTAVADALARVGSTNLNLSSWVGNWELDVIVEDESFADRWKTRFWTTCSFNRNRTRGRRPRPVLAGTRFRGRRSRLKAGSASQTAARIVRLSHALGAAITNHRSLARQNA
jgi:cardiolipin synthase